MNDILQQSRRGSGDSMRATEASVTRETPAVEARDFQLELREEQAGPDGVTERPVVAKKPGNAGGAKGPWFKVNVEVAKDQEIGDEPTNPT